MPDGFEQRGARDKSVSTRVRCAIYTRKSTEEGLEQDFNSLHAQREAAEAYIKSQKHLGWTLLVNHYDESPTRILPIRRSRPSFGRSRSIRCLRELFGFRTRTSSWFWAG